MFEYFIFCLGQQLHIYPPPPPPFTYTQHNSSNALPVGNLSRVKALQVLFAIAPDHLIEKISGASVSDLRLASLCRTYLFSDKSFSTHLILYWLVIEITCVPF